jgi:hypothetical protein
MNGWLMTACVLLFGSAMAHALTGEKVILPRLFRHSQDAGTSRRAADDPSTRQAVRLAWHSVTIALVGYALVLLLAAFDAEAFGSAWAGVTTLLAAVLAALAALSLLMARGRHVGWMWYAAAAMTTWLGIG